MNIISFQEKVAVYFSEKFISVDPFSLPGRYLHMTHQCNT